MQLLHAFCSSAALTIAAGPWHGYHTTPRSRCPQRLAGCAACVCRCRRRRRSSRRSWRTCLRRSRTPAVGAAAAAGWAAATSASASRALVLVLSSLGTAVRQRSRALQPADSASPVPALCCCCCRRLCRHEQVRRWPAEPGQHMLHEQHGAVPLRRARAAAEVRAAGSSPVHMCSRGCAAAAQCQAALRCGRQQAALQ